MRFEIRILSCFSLQIVAAFFEIDHAAGAEHIELATYTG